MGGKVDHTGVRSKISIMPTKYKYPDGSEYIGEWNDEGQRHGLGQISFPEGARYHGQFENGLSTGLGIMTFGDGSRFEGEFSGGKFNGYGVFVRCDGMKYEGEFKDGKVWGLGLLTFADGTHGLPRNEGYFEGSALTRREKCNNVIHKAIQAAER